MGPKNKMKGDKLTSGELGEHPKVRGRKLNIVAMDEGFAATPS